MHVWVDETRPRLQGARLSAWELTRAGVPIHLIADNAAGMLMRRGKVDVVLFGADRVAANGDVANKIGTYKLAVVGRENGVPVYAVVPTSTIDLSITTGDDIEIEERSAEEVKTALHRCAACCVWSAAHIRGCMCVCVFVRSFAFVCVCACMDAVPRYPPCLVRSSRQQVSPCTTPLLM